MAEYEPIENIGFKEVKAEFDKAKQTKLTLEELKNSVTKAEFKKAKQIESALEDLGRSVKYDIEEAYIEEIDGVERDGNDIEVEVETTIVEGRVVLSLKCTFLPDDVPESYISAFGDDIDTKDDVREYSFVPLEEPGVSKEVVNRFREFLSQYFSSDDFLGMGELEQLKELEIIIGLNPKLSFNITSKIPDGYDEALIDHTFKPSIKVELDDDTNTEFVEVFVSL